MRGRVLVTRPEPEARATADRLTRIGFDPIVLPLTRIVALHPQAPDPGRFDMVAVTSANAIRHAPQGLLGRLTSLPCAVVGERTAAAARAAGLDVAIVGEADAAALGQLIAGTKRPGHRVLHLCGRHVAGGLADALSRHDIVTEELATYDAVIEDHGDAEITAILADPPDAVLLYSPRAANAFLALLDRPDGCKAVEHMVFVCISPGVAARFEARPEVAPLVAATPSETAILSVLESRFGDL